MGFAERFQLHVNSKTAEENVVVDGNVRFSILADEIVRVEIGEFTDMATKAVWYRNFDKPEFNYEKTKNIVKITTPKCEFFFDLKRKEMKHIVVQGKKVDDFSEGNLRGTYRTLDGTFGAISLGEGVVSKNGVAVFDDSKSVLLAEDGSILPRNEKTTDFYFMAFGNEYRRAVQYLFKLTGYVPLVPRFCLGNWWSRYKAYSQQEYVDLMEKFLDKEIPITVATIDMDWHWVNIKEKFGKSSNPNRDLFAVREKMWSNGWTGYSWNTDLFPDYKRFLRYLQSKNFKVTVNLHPADGIREFEDMFPEMAKAMGADPEKTQQIKFDITDPKFVDAYFDIVHHPYEEDGVDFWWIDWQQGKKTSVKGLDPLWALNHYHYLDNNRGNNRGLILSRYAELGSHRYPLGFSGDTCINWNCYKFQPYFTSTATNAGYTWWSHDIGGHHMASKDDELYIRWLQFGVFSPINRLHSTSNEFMGKEPWKYRWDVEQLAYKYLKLRHRMIPYLYSMNYRTYSQGIALIEPMYYEYPNEKAAYEAKSQYLFGSELIVAPVINKLNKDTNLAYSDVWLPNGRYTDVFNGRIYEGGKKYRMFRGLENMPVLAKEGAIIPLDLNEVNNVSTNPTDMEILVYRGNSSFLLYEDDGATKDFEKGKSAQRKFEIKENGDEITFTVYPYVGDLSAVNNSVNYKFSFKDIVGGEAFVSVNGVDVDCKNASHHSLALELKLESTDKAVVVVKNARVLKNMDRTEAIIELVSKFQARVDFKKTRFTGFAFDPKKIPDVKKCFREPIEEILALKY